MECWLITSRSEVRRLELDAPPDELCLPDKPLAALDGDAGSALQNVPYVVYTRHDLPASSGLRGFVYSLEAPSAAELELILELAR